MFITVLFTIVKIWKYTKCPSIGEWIKMWDTCRHTLSYCFSLTFYFEDNTFLHIEGLCQPCLKQIYSHHFSNNICSFSVYVLHFGDSHNSQNFFTIIMLVMVICDQWSLNYYYKNIITYWSLRLWLALLSN